MALTFCSLPCSQLLQRSDSYTRVQEAHPEASGSDRGAVINSKAADIEPFQSACVWPSASAAAAGLVSPVSLRASPVPPFSSYSAASRPSPAPRVIVPAVTSSPSFSLEQLANHPIHTFQPHRASISSAPRAPSSFSRPRNSVSSFLLKFTPPPLPPYPSSGPPSSQPLRPLPSVSTDISSQSAKPLLPSRAGAFSSPDA
jgi:hypothetical protein